MSNLADRIAALALVETLTPPPKPPAFVPQNDSPSAIAPPVPAAPTKL